MTRRSRAHLVGQRVAEGVAVAGSCPRRPALATGSVREQRRRRELGRHDLGRAVGVQQVEQASAGSGSVAAAARFAARALRSAAPANTAATSSSVAAPVVDQLALSCSIGSTAFQAASSSRVRYSLRGSDSEWP